MSCNCLKQINERVKEQTGDIEASIPYTYRKKKRDGGFHAKETEGTIVPSFCPWCGVKYKGGES